MYVIHNGVVIPATLASSLFGGEYVQFTPADGRERTCRIDNPHITVCREYPGEVKKVRKGHPLPRLLSDHEVQEADLALRRILPIFR